MKRKCYVTLVWRLGVRDMAEVALIFLSSDTLIVVTSLLTLFNLPQTTIIGPKYGSFLYLPPRMCRNRLCDNADGGWGPLGHLSSLVRHQKKYFAEGMDIREYVSPLFIRFSTFRPLALDYCLAESSLIIRIISCDPFILGQL